MTQEKLLSILEDLPLESKVRLIDTFEQIVDSLLFNGFYEEYNKINEFIEKMKRKWL